MRISDQQMNEWMMYEIKITIILDNNYFIFLDIWEMFKRTQLLIAKMFVLIAFLFVNKQPKENGCKTKRTSF